ncbi:MAG: PAP fibrillin, partial [Cyanobacteriota bacterium]|nr:PAP fibrillin [Cyanobacteriota bacterium]
MPPAAPDSPTARADLLTLLRGRGSGGASGEERERIPALISQLEREQPADLRRDLPLVEGVWELRWSSSSLPYLATAPWLANLQVLSPSRGQGMNL